MAEEGLFFALRRPWVFVTADTANTGGMLTRGHGNVFAMKVGAVRTGSGNPARRPGEGEMGLALLMPRGGRISPEAHGAADARGS